MRRNKPEPGRDVSKILMLYWVECEKCHEEVRWESMWCFETGPYHGSNGVDHYICRQCAPNIGMARTITLDCDKSIEENNQ